MLNISKEQISKYVTKREIEFKQIREFLTQKNFDGVVQIAHKIKGSAALYGFAELGILAKDLEAVARSANAKKAIELVNQMERFLFP